MISDTEIIKRCIKGERFAQEELYNKYAFVMYGLCLRYCSDKDEAKDILQEGFIKVFTNIKKFRNKGSFEGWIKRIIIHTALDYFRKRQKTHLFIGNEDINELIIKNNNNIYYENDNDNDDTLNEKELLSIIQNLPDGYRTVFNLYAIEEYSHKEIAKMLNISESTSKTQLFKARNMLQKKLYEYKKNKNILIL